MDKKNVELKKMILDKLMGDFGKADIDDLVSDKKAGMQKVSVMAKDKKGLIAGLDKAEDVLEGETEESDDDSEDSEPFSKPSEDDKDYSSMSREELLACLKAKK